jgi:hypothetical protein
MKHLTLITITCILLFGCSPRGNEKNHKGKIGTEYFDYDNIDYYFNNFDEGKVPELYDKQSDSGWDSLKMGIIVGWIPDDSSDLTFISKLDSIGYTKSQVDKSKFKSINEVFTEKPVDEILATSCMPVYRDILVFKKSDKIVGVAKICFDCWTHEIVGTASNTVGFGQNGDYDSLKTNTELKTQL